MPKKKLLFLILCFLVVIGHILADDNIEADFEGGSYSLPYDSSDYDDLYADNGYYDDPDQTFEQEMDAKGSGYDDVYEDFNDYYIEKPYESEEVLECRVENGHATIGNTSFCNLQVSVGDSNKQKIASEIEGIYEAVECFGGRALYRRANSTAENSRLLWSSNVFGDWDFSRGSNPEETQIFVYGGELDHFMTPEQVKQWYISGSLIRQDEAASIGDTDDDEFLLFPLNVTCTDGSRKPIPTDLKSPVGPLLTDKEMDVKYRYVYDKYGSTPTVRTISNLTTAILFILTGIVALVSLPRIVSYRSKTSRQGKAGSTVGGTRNSPATSLVQLLGVRKGGKMAEHSK
mmetsp:Transcript_13972/g.24487  ORF Transcript_13972/g.24487 Transcript_13972/m.24487 type:complete len:345 (-) Transcript_13972:2862-3896(-)